MGARGALVATRGETFRVPAVKARVIDATGAGDSFNAGFLACLSARRDPLEECALAGAVAGAKSVGCVGGTAAFE